MNNQKIRRGDIFFADLSPVIGSEQGGTRPVLVIQNDVGNKHSPTTIIAAISTKESGKYLPVHIFVSHSTSCLPENSYILLEQIRTIDSKRLGKKLGHLNRLMMDEIDRAIRVSLGLNKIRRFYNARKRNACRS